MAATSQTHDVEGGRAGHPEEWPAYVCPDDGEELRVGGSELICAAGHRWPIRDGVPILVRDAANYAAAFGIQWERFARTQLDSYTGTTISRDRARRCLGDPLWASLASAPHVLEVGCGAGRFTEVLVAEGARLTSVDYSSAVHVNHSNVGPARHRVAQADVRRLPFRRGQFDLVFCLGVIQHTPSPEETVAALFEQVRPGGWLVFDHYTHNLSWYTKTAPLVRHVLKRLPPEQGLWATTTLVDLFFPMHRAVRGRRWGQRLLSRISPVLTYFGSFPQLRDELHYEWALLDTHDSLTDWYKHFRSRSEIERLLARLGGTEIQCVKGGNGVEARCRRPLGGC